MYVFACTLAIFFCKIRTIKFMLHITLVGSLEVKMSLKLNSLDTSCYLQPILINIPLYVNMYIHTYTYLLAKYSHSH